MKTSQFDRLATSAPLNKTSAVVTGKSGIHWTPKKTFLQPRYDSPQPLSPVPVGMPDLAGNQFCRFKVAGYLGRDGKWLVRCACSAYEERTAKAIRNPKNIVDCCQECQHLLQIKRNQHWLRTGKNLPLEDFL